MLLGKIPVGYIIDVGHILAVSLFLLEIVKDIVEVIKEIIGLFTGSRQRE